MRTLRFSTALMLFGLLLLVRTAAAQTTPNTGIEIEGSQEATYFESNGMTMFVITNGVIVRYTNNATLTVLTADSATFNQDTGDIFADGHVRVQEGSATWIGDHLHYNYQTKVLNGETFRTGQGVVFGEGEKLHGTGVGEATNSIYTGTNGMFTTDDYYRPLQKVRARRFTIVPGKYVEAHDATFFVGNVPVFYLPYYRRSLEHTDHGVILLPGYRSIYGPYLLSTYYWVVNEHLRTDIHADYRERRGFGTGPDVIFDYGDWSQGAFRTYYTHDKDPGLDPFIGTPIPNNRQRIYFNDNAHPQTNLTILAQVAYQSDPFVTRDFFETEYNRDIQPSTFLDANKFWQNWSLETLAQVRINPFWETVERLPEVRLTGFRQQLGPTPVYYESQTTIGYYGRLFSNTNNPLTNPLGQPQLNYYAPRADTFHQLTLPETFFGWLNVTPRVGGRYTFYGDETGPGATNTSHSREVFDTGAQVSFTASRVWPAFHSSFLDMDGMRHIFQPSIDYAYVPQPNVLPSQLPQFDYQLTNNLRLLPLEFPEYNSIDSILGQNTIRYGINNRIQTKRNGQIEDVVNWGVYMDWNLRPNSMQTTFSDIYSDLTLKPRSWLTYNSFLRYSIENGQFNLSQNTITLQPNSTWNWSVGHLYLRSGPIFGQGDNLFTSIFFYRFNENWGTRIAHYFNADTGSLQEQDYTIYRDLRSWTAALTFRELNNLSNGKDYAVAFTFSFKSFPHFAPGQDTVHASPLITY